MKQKQKGIEQELTETRSEIMNHCSEQGVSDVEVGFYKVKIVLQERKEYDDNKLYEALYLILVHALQIGLIQDY